MIVEAISLLVSRSDLTQATIELVFDEIFSGTATPAQIGAFLIALRMKGETPEEIAGAAEVMRRKASKVRSPPGRVVLDTCGTGGDGSHTFNISTAVAFVAAAAGVVVAKHGNRSISSKCGSADVLAAAGVNIDIDANTAEQCLAEVGIAFLFAPAFHAAMKHAAGPRREIGTRSVFNLLGPLANPAGATHQLLGTYAVALVPVVAQTLARLGTRRALVVHSDDGMDEISPCATTRGALVEDGSVRELIIEPEHAAIRRVSHDRLKGGDPATNAAMLTEVLGGARNEFREAVVLNAGAALWVAEMADSIAEGADRARTILDEGAGLRKLRQLAAATHAESQGASSP